MKILCINARHIPRATLKEILRQSSRRSEYANTLITGGPVDGCHLAAIDDAEENETVQATLDEKGVAYRTFDLPKDIHIPVIGRPSPRATAAYRKVREGGPHAAGGHVWADNPVIDRTINMWLDEAFGVKG